MKLTLCALFAGMLLFTGCTKYVSGSSDPNNYAQITHISDARLLQAVDFKAGSYFIYQDSASGSIDSFYVSEYDHGIAPDEYGGNFESASYTATLSIYPRTNLRVTAAGNKVWSTFTYKASVYTDSCFMILPFPEGSTIGTGQLITCVRYFPAYTLGSQSYPNVYEVFTNSGFHTFYSMDAGLIKFSLFLNNGGFHSWELMRQKIVR